MKRTLEYDIVVTKRSRIIVPFGTENELLYIDTFMKRHLKISTLSPNLGVWRNFCVNRNNTNIVCYVLGDGIVPRTAALVALSSKFKVYSIDTNFHILKYNKKVVNDIPRLIMFKGKSSDFDEIYQDAELSCSVVSLKIAIDF